MCAPPIMEKYIETELYPIESYQYSDVEAIAVLNFDASIIKNKKVDNIALRQKITYDITKGLYQTGKVRVIQGQTLSEMGEIEIAQNTKGDYKAKTSTIQREVKYEVNPFQKVDAVLSGKVVDYELNRQDPDYDYIEMIIQLADNVDGTLYWVSRIKGYYKDVIYTTCNTIANHTYTEPGGATVMSAGIPANGGNAGPGTTLNSLPPAAE